MSLESGTYISDLVPTNPVGTDPKSAGDDHIRLLKSTLQATLPFTGPIGDTYAPIASPTFTGDPRAPTPIASDNDTSIATTAYVTNAITGKVSKTGDTMTGPLTIVAGNLGNLKVDNTGQQYTSIDLLRSGIQKASWWWDETANLTQLGCSPAGSKINFATGGVDRGYAGPNGWALKVLNMVDPSVVGGEVAAMRATTFGYSTSYKALVIGGTAAVTVGIGYDVNTNNAASFSGNGTEVFFRDGVKFCTGLSNTMYLGTISMTGGNVSSTGNITAFSDRRLKKDIDPIDNALEKVCTLTGYNFTRTDTGMRQTGLIAQEVQEVLPEAVIEVEGNLALAYGNMVGLLVNAIKELKAEVDTLKAQIK